MKRRNPFKIENLIYMNEDVCESPKFFKPQTCKFLPVNRYRNMYMSQPTSLISRSINILNDVQPFDQIARFRAIKFIYLPKVVEPQGLNGSDIPPSIRSTVETEKQLIDLIEQQSAEATHTNSDNNDNNLITVMENIENFESNFTCGVCHNGATGAHKCDYYNNVIQEITLERDDSHKGLKHSDEKMINNTFKKRSKLEIGDSVLA
ncbi:hypothetical protein WA026_001692 [Henosepilachna vigintioctopunctata]|uniref:Uncharacterized protein n=1 Tax=Henosepilachna vigintioctopunctata TaxID=420089 RepID=A0AAW1UUK8_9CUCU